MFPEAKIAKSHQLIPSKGDLEVRFNYSAAQPPSSICFTKNLIPSRIWCLWLEDRTDLQLFQYQNPWGQTGMLPISEQARGEQSQFLTHFWPGIGACRVKTRPGAQIHECSSHCPHTSLAKVKIPQPKLSLAAYPNSGLGCSSMPFFQKILKKIP